MSNKENVPESYLPSPIEWTPQKLKSCSLVKRPLAKKSYSGLNEPQKQPLAEVGTRFSPRNGGRTQTSPLANDVKLPNRQFSQTTGLAKFSLSPKASQGQNTIKLSPTKGLVVRVPITTSHHEVEVVQQDLLSQYATKHAQLVHHQDQVKQLKFELNEISIKIENAHRQSLLNEKKPVDVYSQAHLETTKTLKQFSPPQSPSKLNLSPFFDEAPIKSLKNKASTMFQDSKHLDENLTLLKNRASTMFNDDPKISMLKNKASSIFQLPPTLNHDIDELSQKTSQFFTNKTSQLNTKTSQFFNDTTSELNNKTSQFLNGVFSMSPKKTTFLNTISNLSPTRPSTSTRNTHNTPGSFKSSPPDDLVNSSFNIENLPDAPNEHSLIEDANSYFTDDSHLIDIDDYTSEDEL
jgi:hypothetical protein